jgi:3',5'-cyclic AMP phosphodiesterase CpdA
MLRGFAVKTHLMIGNHDDRAHFAAVFPNKTRDASGFVQSRRRTGHGDFLFLDTVDPGYPSGRYCAPRLAWLEQRLAEADGRPVYLFLHHPPFAIGIPGLDGMGVLDAEPLAGLLAATSGIRHLFFGHVHRPVWGTWQGIGFSAMRSLNHQVALDMTGPGLVYSHEAPAYAVVLLEDDRTVVHLNDYLDRSRYAKGRAPPDGALQRSKSATTGV